MTDQATELRRLMAQADPGSQTVPGRRARVLAVTSGKGGVGKSNLAVNLAAALSKAGQRVILFDADMGMANADLLCNINATANLAHVLVGRRSVEETMVQAPGGFTLLPGASGLAKMADLSPFERARVVQVMETVEQNHDVLIVDTGAGIGPAVLGFCAAADQVLTVTTPEPTAVTDAYGLIKVLATRSESPNVGLVVNMARDGREAAGVFERFQAACEGFLGLTLADLGHVPLDPSVPQAVRRRVPFCVDNPRSPASLCVHRLANKLDLEQRPMAKTGFVRRVVRWLAG